MSARIRIGTVVAAGAVLMASTAGPAAWAETQPAPGHDAAAAAAKKKKKGKRKKKCRRRDQSPVFNALSCRSLVRTFPNSPPAAEGSERYDFCRNNTYRYRKASYDFDARFFTTTYRGRWKVISSTSGSAGVSGAIQYTVAAYRSAFSDGSPAETPPPSLLSQSIAFGPFSVDFGGTTYLIRKAPC
jgi:hypothetical protein